MSDVTSLNLKSARDYVYAYKKNNRLDVELVIDAINSIEKRINYLKYFYDLFSDLTYKEDLLFDRIGVDLNTNEPTLRHKYEATAFAFLSNLHELIDSYPFIYLGIHKENINNQKYLDWKNLYSFKESMPVSKMIELKESVLYKKLDAINNSRKHRTLPKISNEYTHLKINTSHTKTENYEDLKQLIHELHNELIPPYFEILALTFNKN